MAALAATLPAEAGEAEGSAIGAALPPPIRPVEREPPPPLSFAQERLWFLDQLDPASAAYNIPSAFALTGDLDAVLLQRAFAEVVRRHETLRTTFGRRGERPVQVIAASGSWRLPVVDLSGSPEPRWALAEALALAEVRKPFDLAAGPLLRVTLLRADRRRHLLVVSLHHIVSDGWSVARLVGEVTALYDAFSRGEASPLPELPFQYADFAVWQRAWLAGGEMERQLGWWQQQLAGVQILELPTDRPRPAVETFRGAELPITLDAGLTADLEALARERGATLFMVLLAGYEVLLSRYSGQRDVVVGSPIANRNRREIEELIGFFANTLVLRTDLSGDPPFREVLERVQETTLGAYARQDVPFERLVERLQPDRDLSRNPLFQVELVFQNQPRPATLLPGLESRQLAMDAGIAKFDLTFFLSRVGERLEGLVEYNTDLFDRVTARRMARHLQQVLAGLRRHLATPLSALPLLSEIELHQVLREWNDPVEEALCGRLVHRLVEERAAAQADELAVLDGERRLTYGELNARANQLAWRLIELGIGPESIVGICVERSLEMVIGLLGVLKAGGAVLALDPAYPLDRLSYIIREAGLSVLLVDDLLREVLPEHDGVELTLDRDWRDFAGRPEGNPEVHVWPENPMYIIYTSGTTGKPKGIVVTHLAFSNLLEWQLRQSGLPRPDGEGRAARTVQFATFGFCVSFQEIFTSWCSGSALVLAGEMVRRDIDGLAGFLEAHGVERLHLPFAALKHLAEAAATQERLPSRLTEVITAGEPLLVNPAVRRLFTRLGCVLRNQYGASETHVVTSFSLAGEVASWPAIPPVGRNITGVAIHLLDRALRPVAVGVPGALFSTGRCEARGYLAEPVMTAEKYVPDPFTGTFGGRLYRTGDLARRLPGGEIEFLGRIDDQVKIRGYRLELGEVDTVLARHPKLRDVASLVRPTDTGNLLVSYLVLEEPMADVTAELTAYMKARVPEHMVPSAFVVMDWLPVNANGKLDREALPAPEVVTGRAKAATATLRNATEELLAELWQEVLGGERPGPEDDFFDLGGHSILATQLISRVRLAFEVELPLMALFESPTLGGLAAVLEESRERRAGRERCPPWWPEDGRRRRRSPSPSSGSGSTSRPCRGARSTTCRSRCASRASSRRWPWRGRPARWCAATRPCAPASRSTAACRCRWWSRPGPVPAAGGGPPGPSRGRAGSEGPAPGRPRGRPALRSRPGAAPRLVPAAAGTRGARLGDQPPPHRLRRLVHRRAGRRDGGALRRLPGGPTLHAAGSRGPVRRLRRLAAALALG